MTPLKRILVVDDSARFRNLVGSILSPRADWTIVAEAADGSEAVERAKKLSPEVILLDIAMPKMNGMKAAEHILTAIPSTKIILLSQETSADLVQEATRLNVWGYVTKAKAARDLVAAIESVLAGKKFFTPELDTRSNRQYPENDQQS